jgi:lysophospholipase L1-like esterase
MGRTVCAFLAALVVLAQTPVPEQPDPAQRRSPIDYGLIGRYAAENSRLAAPAPHEDRVVFMGDSITDFWGRRNGRFFPGKPYLNRGISAQVTPQMLIRFRQDVVDLKPKVVVILAGTNDIGGSNGPIPTEGTKCNLLSMIDLAEYNKIKVVLASLLPVTDAYAQQTIARPPERLIELNDWMKAIAASRNLVYLDYHSAMVDDKGMLRKELTHDGVHPNDAGYELMGPLAEKAIAAALAR